MSTTGRPGGEYRGAQREGSPVNAAIDPGCVRIRLEDDGTRIVAVRVASMRPQAGRVFAGRPAAAAVALVPVVFALCGRAQGAAARLAVAAARGEESTPRLVPDVVREVMREHLWRWLLDLPALLGLPLLRDQLAVAVRAVDAGSREVVRDLLAAPEMLRMGAAIEALEQPPVRPTALLRIGSAAASLADWPRITDTLCRTPTWRGQAAETGAWARGAAAPAGMRGAFAARWMARLAELRTWAAGEMETGAGGTASAIPVAPGVGRAAVETARGLLLHEVALAGERITDYRIVAPTEWNFHQEGPLPGWLLGKPIADEADLRRFAAHAVAALDPCVRWELERPARPTGC